MVKYEVRVVRYGDGGGWVTGDLLWQGHSWSRPVSPAAWAVYDRVCAAQKGGDL